MRIGLVCPYNVFAGGGVQECVFAMRTELLKRGHDAWIISPLPRARNAKKAPDGVLFVGRAASVKSFHTTAQISASADNESIDELLREYDFDILHFHEPWVPFVSRQILSRSNVHNVATFHAKLPENRMNRTIEKVITPYTKSIMKSLDSLTAVSDAAAEYVATLTDRRIRIVPNGIDIDKFTFRRSDTDREQVKKIVYIGRLERRKGIQYLLAAFDSLTKDPSNASIELHIAGSGPDERRLKQLAAENNTPRVTFHGYISEKKKLEFLRQAHLFCSPAPYGESFGIVLLEAMAIGVPIVAGDNPGYRAVMDDRGSISIVDPKDIEALRDRLQLLIHDTELRKLWRRWAKKYVKQYSYEKVVDQYEQIYKETCLKDQ